MHIVIGMMIPFLGTAVGAALVFFLREELEFKTQKWLSGLAAGIMLAASIWSLLIPAINLSDYLGNGAFIPASVGVILGMLFMFMLDRWILSYERKGRKEKLLFFAVAFHNIPEGMVVGVALAGMMAAHVELSSAAVFALTIGIGLQNIPEGAIISLPMKAGGKSRIHAWLKGMLTALVELGAAVITLILFSSIAWSLPYMLSMAAGAMIHVVVKELIPELFEENQGSSGYFGFLQGFVLMMILDIVFA